MEVTYRNSYRTWDLIKETEQSLVKLEIAWSALQLTAPDPCLYHIVPSKP